MQKGLSVMDSHGVSAGRPVGSTGSHLLTPLTLSCRDEKKNRFCDFFLFKEAQSLVGKN